MFAQVSKIVPLASKMIIQSGFFSLSRFFLQTFPLTNLIWTSWERISDTLVWSPATRLAPGSSGRVMGSSRDAAVTMPSVFFIQGGKEISGFEDTKGGRYARDCNNLRRPES
jgi:hypothetical protein